MIVVADAGPLRYLIEIDLIAQIPAQYGELYVPGAVLNELSQPITPSSVKLWLAKPPFWFHIVDAADRTPKIPTLDLGESEALKLAIKLEADFLLIDDQAARKAAPKYINASVTGTLGVIYEVSRLSLRPAEEFRQNVGRLRLTTFYFSHQLNQVIDRLQAEMEVAG
ncbi:hypothetical protein [Granulicella tundricola]|uniref:DUF3368 domain-containing protein n=1 Tax=Granulicella tundricola (strain ATCC BAA-1859 / DSM 23138 / MP5ACTX9) TaxID=1198114 RepID=E8X077_GRATM|nr:hypothetical protein [Granulicella tundricola]ADW70058.1 conserved hypothetical protein containing PIN domain protein [Granulicella tundricola MP5ACTX9]